MPKYHIPQIPYRIAIPSRSGRSTTSTIPTTPGRLPQYLRQALATGRCREQTIVTTTQPTIMYTDAATPTNPHSHASASAGSAAANLGVADSTGNRPETGPDSPIPDPVVTRETQLIDQLVDQLTQLRPTHSPYQLIAQALQQYINTITNQPTDPPPDPLLDARPTTEVVEVDAVSHLDGRKCDTGASTRSA